MESRKHHGDTETASGGELKFFRPNDSNSSVKNENTTDKPTAKFNNTDRTQMMKLPMREEVGAGVVEMTAMPSRLHPTSAK